MKINNTIYYTRAEAAEYCGMSTRTIDRMRNGGVFRYYQTCPNGKVFIPQSELDAHFRKNTRYYRRKEQ